MCVRPSVQTHMSCKNCELYMTFRKRDMKFYVKDTEQAEKEQNISHVQST